MAGKVRSSVDCSCTAAAAAAEYERELEIDVADIWEASRQLRQVLFVCHDSMRMR